MPTVRLELVCEQNGQKALIETIDEARFLALTRAFLLTRQEQNIEKLRQVDKQLGRAERLQLKRLKFLLDYLIPIPGSNETETKA